MSHKLGNYGMSFFAEHATCKERKLPQKLQHFDNLHKYMNSLFTLTAHKFYNVPMNTPDVKENAPFQFENYITVPDEQLLMLKMKFSELS